MTTREERTRALLGVILDVLGLALVVLATVPEWRLRRWEAIARAKLDELRYQAPRLVAAPPGEAAAVIEHAEAIAREAATEGGSDG